MMVDYRGFLPHGRGWRTVCGSIADLLGMNLAQEFLSTVSKRKQERGVVDVSMMDGQLSCYLLRVLPHVGRAQKNGNGIHLPSVSAVSMCG